MKINILIIGLGNIGKRHLQSVSNTDECDQISIFDTSPQMLNSVFDFCKDNQISVDRIKKMVDFQEAVDSVGEKTVVIIATTAENRTDIIESVIKNKPLAIIAEKPLCQTIEQYAHIQDLSKKYDVDVYVDFVRHVYPGYQKVYRGIKDEKIKSYHAITWGGVACVGIHALENMTWLLNANKYEFLYESQPDIYDTKRPGYKDFTGDLALLINEDILFSLNVLNDPCPEVYQVTTEKKQYIINQSSGNIIESDVEGQTNVSEFEMLYVSQCTQRVLNDIVNQEKIIRLPTIDESFLAHKILFDYMQKYNIQGAAIT